MSGNSATGNAAVAHQPGLNAAAVGFAAPRGAIRYVCLVLLLAPWTVDAVRVVHQGFETAVTPVPTCLTEMHIVHGMQQVARGQPLYPVVDGLPFTYHLYNPLTYLPAGWAAGWLDLEIDRLLVAGRILPFCSMFGLLLALAYYVRRQTGDWWAAALCVLMVIFYHSTTLTDFFRNRPETPGLLLTLGGWIAVQLRSRRWPFLAAVLFVAAIAFKPIFVAAPLACGLQLLLQREHKSLLQLTATCLMLGMALVASSYYWLGHGYFQHTLWAMQACPLDPITASREFFPILIHGHWGMLFPAALVAAGWLAAKGHERNLLLYLLVCLLLTSIAHGKQGADLNYHGELSLLMVVTVVIALWHMFRATTVLAWAPLLLLLLGTWMPIFEFGPGWNELSHQRILRNPFAYAGPPASDAAALAEAYRPYRSEALILHDEMAVRVGDPVVYDWYALRILFDVGHLDFDRLQQAIQQRRYAVIVFRSDVTDRWSLALQAAARASGYHRAQPKDGLLEFWR